MFIPALSGLVVSVDAFFIGLSLGLQKNCKFLYLVAINAFLFGLCILGFLIAGYVYTLIPFDPDIVVGVVFIALGLWTMRVKRRKKTTIILVGLVMSLEAMLITMGLTFIFIQNTTFIIPITVALAHFAYSACSFYLARTKRMSNLPVTLSHIISGLALIIYGLMALFIDFGI